jgi:hypothetical protein
MSQTDNQRQIANTLDIAGQVVVAYAAPEVPELGNLTPEGLLEEFGRLNEARKALEKTEKIVKQRLLSQMSGDALRGDNYNVKIEEVDRYALNQKAAKEKLKEQGVPEEEYMASSTSSRVTVKRN